MNVDLRLLNVDFFHQVFLKEKEKRTSIDVNNDEGKSSPGNAISFVVERETDPMNWWLE